MLIENPKVHYAHFVGMLQRRQSKMNEERMSGFANNDIKDDLIKKLSKYNITRQRQYTIIYFCPFFLVVFVTLES